MSWVEELAGLGREVTNDLVGVVRKLYRHDPLLADQLLRSAKSMARKLDDAQYAVRRERERLFDEAGAAIAEAHTALYLAESFGHLQPFEADMPRRQLNRALAILGTRDAALLPAVSDSN
jgi:hypothetical protein